MINRRADDRQSDCQVDAGSKRYHLKRNQPLIMVQRHDGVIIAPGGLAKQSIGREWITRQNTLSLSGACRRPDQADFFVAE